MRRLLRTVALLLTLSSLSLGSVALADGSGWAKVAYPLSFAGHVEQNIVTVGQVTLVTGGQVDATLSSLEVTPLVKLVYYPTPDEWWRLEVDTPFNVVAFKGSWSVSLTAGFRWRNKPPPAKQSPPGN